MNLTQILTTASIVLTLALLAWSLSKGLRRSRLRPVFDIVRIVVQIAVVVTIPMLTGVTTPTTMLLGAVALGGAVGFFQGQHLEVAIEGKKIFVNRSIVGFVIWGGGLILMQAAGLANRTGLVQIGQGISWLSIGIAVGLLLGRHTRVDSAIKAATTAVAAMLLFGGIGATILVVSDPPPAEAGGCGGCGGGGEDHPHPGDPVPPPRIEIVPENIDPDAVPPSAPIIDEGDSLFPTPVPPTPIPEPTATPEAISEPTETPATDASSNNEPLGDRELVPDTDGGSFIAPDSVDTQNQPEIESPATIPTEPNNSDDVSQDEALASGIAGLIAAALAGAISWAEAIAAANDALGSAGRTRDADRLFGAVRSQQEATETQIPSSSIWNPDKPTSATEPEPAVTTQNDPPGTKPNPTPTTAQVEPDAGHTPVTTQTEPTADTQPTPAPTDTPRTDNLPPVTPAEVRITPPPGFLPDSTVIDGRGRHIGFWDPADLDKNGRVSMVDLQRQPVVPTMDYLGDNIVGLTADANSPTYVGYNPNDPSSPRGTYTRDVGRDSRIGIEENGTVYNDQREVVGRRVTVTDENGVTSTHLEDLHGNPLSTVDGPDGTPQVIIKDRVTTQVPIHAREMPDGTLVDGNNNVLGHRTGGTDANPQYMDDNGRVVEANPMPYASDPNARSVPQGPYVEVPRPGRGDGSQHIFEPGSEQTPGLQSGEIAGNRVGLTPSVQVQWENVGAGPNGELYGPDRTVVGYIDSNGVMTNLHSQEFTAVRFGGPGEAPEFINPADTRAGASNSADANYGRGEPLQSNPRGAMSSTPSETLLDRAMDAPSAPQPVPEGTSTSVPTDSIRLDDMSRHPDFDTPPPTNPDSAVPASPDSGTNPGTTLDAEVTPFQPPTGSETNLNADHARPPATGDQTNLTNDTPGAGTNINPDQPSATGDQTNINTDTPGPQPTATNLNPDATPTRPATGNQTVVPSTPDGTSTPTLDGSPTGTPVGDTAPTAPPVGDTPSTTRSAVPDGPTSNRFGDVSSRVGDLADLAGNYHDNVTNHGMSPEQAVAVAAAQTHAGNLTAQHMAETGRGLTQTSSSITNIGGSLVAGGLLPSGLDNLLGERLAANSVRTAFQAGSAAMSSEEGAYEEFLLGLEARPAFDPFGAIARAADEAARLVEGEYVNDESAWNAAAHGDVLNAQATQFQADVAGGKIFVPLEGFDHMARGAGEVYIDPGRAAVDFYTGVGEIASDVVHNPVAAVSDTVNHMQDSALRGDYSMAVEGYADVASEVGRLAHDPIEYANEVSRTMDEYHRNASDAIDRGADRAVQIIDGMYAWMGSK